MRVFIRLVYVCACACVRNRNVTLVLRRSRGFTRRVYVCMERKRNVGIVPFNVTLALRRSKYKGTRSRYRGALEPQSLATSFEWQNADVMVLRKGETKDLSLELELV